MIDTGEEAPGPDFVPGLDLAAAYYAEVVAPLVPVRHAAALIGPGSDVLGYDTPRSTDHDWGPRVLLFTAAADVASTRTAVEAALPARFRGWSTTFGSDRNPLHHGVVVTTLGEWAPGVLGVDLPLSAQDWLAVAPQRLLEVTAGRVFADPDGELARLRTELAYYPDPVWLELIAREWDRVEADEPLVGRCAELGDDLGSRLAAARLVQALMRLAFLLERTYWPYAKWFGTAFGRLQTAPDLAPALDGAARADTFSERQAALVEAYERLARRHNGLGLTARLDPTVRLFHDRPFLVLAADRFAAACRASASATSHDHEGS